MDHVLTGESVKPKKWHTMMAWMHAALLAITHHCCFHFYWAGENDLDSAITCNRASITVPADASLRSPIGSCAMILQIMGHLRIVLVR
jgi:hypothetical protein